MPEEKTGQQIFLSGIGGQGILFITRLLAETAVHKELPVLTSETHGMAQRGGTVVSHLKIGGFTSPLIRPGRADGLLLLKAENLAQHRFYLKPGGWIVMNARSLPPAPDTSAGAVLHAAIHHIDADRLAEETGNPQSVNAIMLGFAAARASASAGTTPALFCSAEDIVAAIHQRFGQREKLLRSALEAFDLGLRHGR